MYRRELYDGGDHGQCEVNPVASAAMKVSPVGTKAKAYLDGQNYRHNSFGVVFGSQTRA